jgi:hypothetical protein
MTINANEGADPAVAENAVADDTETSVSSRSGQWELGSTSSIPLNEGASASAETRESPVGDAAHAIVLGPFPADRASPAIGGNAELDPPEISLQRLIAPTSEPHENLGPTPEALLIPLEERIRKLELALAELQNTSDLESRVAARVSNQIAQELAPGGGASSKASLVELGKRLLGVMSPPAPRTLGPRPDGKRPGWLVLELWAEARAIFRMYVDPRYRMTWVGRVVPVVLVIAFIFASYCVALIPLIGPFLVKIPFLVEAVQLLMAFVLFKVLSHEARRFRQTSPDIPSSLRL